LRSGREHFDPELAVAVRRRHSDPELAVEVRRGTLRPRAWGEGPAGTTAIKSLQLRSGGGGAGGGTADIKSNNHHLTGREKHINVPSAKKHRRCFPFRYTASRFTTVEALASPLTGMSPLTRVTRPLQDRELRHWYPNHDMFETAKQMLW